MEDSPPPFIVIRSPSVAVPHLDVYELSLQLVSAVHELVDSTVGRYPLKKQLDQFATSIVMQLARLKSTPRRPEWQMFRNIHTTAVEAAAVVDIMMAQGAAGAAVERARAIAAQLVRQLAPLGLLGY